MALVCVSIDPKPDLTGRRGPPVRGLQDLAGQAVWAGLPSTGVDHSRSFPGRSDPPVIIADSPSGLRQQMRAFRPGEKGKA